MSQSLLKRFTRNERLVHWAHMLSFILLTLTGLGLYARFFFGLTWFFGGVEFSRALHHWVGLIFTVTTVLVFFQWFRDITAPGEDTVATVVKNYLDPRSDVAPSGKFNAGQKMAGWAALILGLLMAVTGIFMWFPFILIRGIQQWMYFLHNLGFTLFMGFIAIHVYLGTIGVPGTWRAMTSGTVTKAWARKNHPKWDAEEA